MMEFFLDMTPPRATAQQKKVAVIKGRVIVYPSKKAKEAKKEFMNYLMQYRPPEPLTGPIALEVIWHFEAITYKDREWKVSRPDTDNIAKMLKDVMTDCGFWKDDAQVCVEHIEKIWSKTPGINIKIKQLERFKNAR